MSKATSDDEESLLKVELNPGGKLHADSAPQRRILGVPASLFAGGLYCLASMGMVLLNKVALSTFHFRSANALLFFQCLVCVVSVKLCEVLGVVKNVEPFSLKVTRVWFPVNLIFVGMIGTSFWALQTLNVAMVTVLKQLANLFTVGGDYYFYGRTYSLGVWGCMLLMIVSALCSAYTDLTFDANGYFWQTVNCGFAAAYSLYLRGVMDRVPAVTSTGKKLDEFSMVYYNNLLSLPPILIMMFGNGEVFSVWSEPDLWNPSFLTVAALSGIIGFGISFTSLWFISTTTPTIYSLVGSLNKVPLAIIGLFAFHTPWTTENLLSIMVGLVAGVLFVIAKSRS
ncbi:hypothetical protein N2152v2_002125 [Parachlorella kessleri]